MAKRIALILLAAVISCGGVACKKDKKSTEAEKVAKFRAEQKKKAVNAYQELVKKYPDSQYADKAKERLKAIGPTPAPKK